MVHRWSGNFPSTVGFGFSRPCDKKWQAVIHAHPHTKSKPMTPTAPLTTVPPHLHPSHLEVPLCPRHSCPSLRRPASPATNERDSRPPRLFLRVRQVPPQTPFYLPMQIKISQTSTKFLPAPDTRPPRSLLSRMGGYLPNSPPPPPPFSATSPLGGEA